jgi:hypothetical protein
VGNRGNVIFVAPGYDGGQTISPNIYLHWNGGPESIYAFLAELDKRGVRADAQYDAARFVQIVGEFLDSGGQGGLSLGIVQGPSEISPEALGRVQTDASDNGFYVVDRSATVQSGQPPIVRRFTYDWPVATLSEWPQAKVSAEREQALAQSTAYVEDYFDTLRERLAKV